MRRRSLLQLVLLLTAVAGVACQRPEEPGVQDRSPRPADLAEDSDSPSDDESTQTQEPTRTTEPEIDRAPANSTTVSPSEDGDKTSDTRRNVRRPVDGWVIFRESFKPKEDAACDANWTGRNHFEIKTENVQRMTIDMMQLPEGAPKKGPWVFQIDGQGVELTGFRPAEGYTGLKRDLVRSQNGKWSVDRNRLYRPGE